MLDIFKSIRRYLLVHLFFSLLFLSSYRCLFRFFLFSFFFIFLIQIYYLLQINYFFYLHWLFLTFEIGIHKLSSSICISFCLKYKVCISNFEVIISFLVLCKDVHRLTVNNLDQLLIMMH